MRKIGKRGLSPICRVFCFAAGTLIHTKEGLKPIEQIQVGDRVLTQPEDTGERTYKRVTRTMCIEDAPVWTVTYFPKAELEKARAEGRMMPDGLDRRLVVTPNHPFWVKEKGWIQVKDLERHDLGGEEFELADGQSAIVSSVCPLYRTEMEGVAWQEGMFTEWAGSYIDLNDPISAEFVPEYCEEKEITQPRSVELWNDESYFRCSVFNFELEDCHTYYVGTLGVWVHNTNCGETTKRVSKSKGSETIGF